LQQLLIKFNLDLIAYTRCPAGSVLVTADKIDIHPGFPRAMQLIVLGQGIHFSQL
jgi:hypothetical protein